MAFSGLGVELSGEKKVRSERSRGNIKILRGVRDGWNFVAEKKAW